MDTPPRASCVAVTPAYLPANREAIFLLPLDLLSSEERRRVDQLKF